jgi:Na+/phosphate symporter
MLRDISKKALFCYDEAILAITQNKPEHAEATVQGAEEIQALREEYKAGHLERALGGEYNVQSSLAFMEAVRHMSRIASHSKSIAEIVISDEAEISG